MKRHWEFDWRRDLFGRALVGGAFESPIYFFCWSSSLMAGAHTFYMWRSVVSGVRTPASA